MNKPFALRTHEEMLDVLMDPKAPGPAEHYYMIRGGSALGNITVWAPGTVGGEYIKAYGHYHVDDFIETYEVISGEGILLLQARKKDSSGAPIDDEVEYVKAVFLERGKKIAIPKGAAHLMANIGASWLATRDDSPVEFGAKNEAAWPAHADYSAVKKMRGFAYYVVNQQGRPGFVKNPLYKNTPDIIIERA